MLCKCQDSTGKVCNKPLSTEEYDQDGMCSTCADNVWEEMNNPEYFWEHESEDN